MTDIRTEVDRLRTELRQIKTTQLRATVAENMPTGTLLLFATATAPTGFLNCDGAAVSETTYADLFALIAYTYGNPGGGNFNLPDTRGRTPIGVGTLGSDTYAIADTGGEARHTLTEAELAVHDHTVGSLTPTGGQSASHDHGASGLTTGNQSTSHRHTGANHVHSSGGYSASASFVAFLATDADVSGGAERYRESGGFDTGSHTHSITGNSGNPTSLPNGGLQNASHTHAISGTTANQSAGHNHPITGSVANAGSGTAHENRPPYLAINYMIKT